MSMAYIRKYYKVPAKRGMTVEAYRKHHDGWQLAYRGRITSASCYVHIDGMPFHPTWGLVYYDKDGSVLCDTRKVSEEDA
jgi:hypothetical protein